MLLFEWFFCTPHFKNKYVYFKFKNCINYFNNNVNISTKITSISNNNNNNNNKLFQNFYNNNIYNNNNNKE